ncbi:MAG: hypothetical protein H0T46_16265 [Deltaproteobacteria bacterium]|nr:hypothetical protein [Deltaproteobacteria bacterium]
MRQLLLARDRDRHRDHDRELDEDEVIGSDRLARPRSSALDPRAGEAWTPPIGPAVQLFATAVNAGVHDPHAIAAHGFGGSTVLTPHLAQVQRAFGRHDVSGVRAFVGGSAAEASCAAADRMDHTTAPDPRACARPDR